LNHNRYIDIAVMKSHFGTCVSSRKSPTSKAKLCLERLTIQLRTVPALLTLPPCHQAAMLAIEVHTTLSLA